MIINKVMIESIKKAQRLGDVVISVQNKKMVIGSYSVEMFYNAGYVMETDTPDETFNLDANIINAIVYAGDNVELSKEGTIIKVKAGSYEVACPEPAIKNATTIDISDMGSITNSILFNLNDINKVSYSALVGAADKPYLNGVNFKVSENNVQICATEGIRMARAIFNTQKVPSKEEKEFIDTEFTIDKQILDKAIQILNREEPVVMSFSENTVFLISNYEFIGLKKLACEYTNLVPIFDGAKKSCVNSVTFNKKQLIHSMSRCTLSNDLQGIQIEGSLANRTCTLSPFGSNNIALKVKDSIEAKMNKDFKFKVKASMLKDAINQINSDNVTIEFGDKIQVIQIVKDNVCALIAPCNDISTEN